MILDELGQADRYAALSEGIRAALEFLRRPATALLEPPDLGPENSLRAPIIGDEVFALVQRYRTKGMHEGFWEAHRRHADVQCVVEGAEIMGHAPLARARVLKPYEAERDLIVLEPAANQEGCNHVRVSAGMFVIFFPEDAHMPGLSLPDSDSRVVKKIVVKVRVDE